MMRDNVRQHFKGSPKCKSRNINFLKAQRMKTYHQISLFESERKKFKCEKSKTKKSTKKLKKVKSEPDFKSQPKTVARKKKSKKSTKNFREAKTVKKNQDSNLHTIPEINFNFCPQNKEIKKVSARLRPKVKDPFEKRMKLQAEFRNASIIPSSPVDEFEATDKNDFENLLEKL